MLMFSCFEYIVLLSLLLLFILLKLIDLLLWRSFFLFIIILLVFLLISLLSQLCLRDAILPTCGKQFGGRIILLRLQVRTHKAS